MVTRRAIRTLHAKLNFLPKINMEYDPQFAESGAKIGNILNIRKPPKFYVRTGTTMSTQDVTETYVPLQVSNTIGVDITFSSSELTLSIEDFNARILDKAMAQLAASLESAVLTAAYKLVPQASGSTASVLNSLRPVLKAKQYMENALAPEPRTMLLNTDSTVEMVDAHKGLFQSSTGIADQYTKGVMGVVGGFNFSESTLLPAHTPGAHGGTPLTDYGTAFVSGTATLVTNGWTNSITGILKAGDVFTIADVYAVHPETKATLGYLKQFVVLADADSGASTGPATLSIYPAPTFATVTVNGVVTKTAATNVNALPGNDKAIVVVGTASTPYGVNLGFHKDFLTFATADLVDVSKYGAWGAREQFDGISMRIGRQWTISDDQFPTRIDVFYGFAVMYPELACRVHNLISNS
jgi:hypothetical protein